MSTLTPVTVGRGVCYWYPRNNVTTGCDKNRGIRHVSPSCDGSSSLVLRSLSTKGVFSVFLMNVIQWFNIFIRHLFLFAEFSAQYNMVRIVVTLPRFKW